MKCWAPGKVILLGEHFVVSGAPAVAVAVNLGVTAEAVEASDGRVVVEAPICSGEVYPRCEARGCEHLCAAARFLAARLGGITGARVRLESSLPLGAGLGSSAASAAAFSAALAALSSSLDLELVNAAAFEAEKVVHGKPSGIDNTVSVYGGAIIYRRGVGVVRRIEPRLEGYSLLVADSGRPRSTRVAVEMVQGRLARLGRIGEELVKLAGMIADAGAVALERGDALLLGELMDVNHGLLVAVGVSTVELDAMVHAARSAGALGAKLTGAGLGGCVAALARRGDARRVASAMSAAGAVAVYTAELSRVGVQCTSP